MSTAPETLPIIEIGNPILREQSQALSAETLALAETQLFIDQMIASMRAAGGVGLAAVQLARPIRVCVIEVAQNQRYPYMPDLPLRVLVNPQLTALGSETVQNYEGCLSVPGLRGAVERPLALHVRAWDRFGQVSEVDYYGLAAVIVSHECDHMNGTLFTDRLSDPRSLCTWEMYEANYRQKETEKWMQIQSCTRVAERDWSASIDCDSDAAS